MIRSPWLEIAIGAILAVLGCVVAMILADPVRADECIIASYYGTESGSRTANGERFTGNDLTAAHRTLPFNTKLRVTYHGKSVVVRINDRGPFIRGRSLDLSRAAAARIGLIHAGVGKVCVERL
jgi:rare lipoprotein A